MATLLRPCTVVLLLASAISAQCQTQWVPGEGIAGVDDLIHAAVRWDPDGAGPLPPALVVAGRFRRAGSVAADRIAAWDGVAWAALGSGWDGQVHELAVLPNGDLVAAGDFANAGGTAAANIARFDGVQWSPLGAGCSGPVHALQVLPTGDLAVAGSFVSAGGVPATSVARWDGTAWHAFGSGLESVGDVGVLAVLPTGELLAGGYHLASAGVEVGGVARWNGTAWVTFGTGSLPLWAERIVVAPTGDVFVSGSTWQSSIVRSNGGTWQPIVGAPSSGPFAMAIDTNGDLHVVAAFVNLFDRELRRWTPAGFVLEAVLPSPSTGARLFALPGGELLYGASFLAIEGQAMHNVALFSGGAWQALGTGTFGSVSALVRAQNGDLLAAGRFSRRDPGGVSMLCVARHDGTAWLPLPGGIDPSFATSVDCMAELANGDIVVGGRFTRAAGVSVRNIVRWDGTAWQSLGSGTDGRVRALLRLADGSLLAAGEFHEAGGLACGRLARWDGTAWSAFGGTGLQGSEVRALAQVPNGDVYVGGSFWSAGGIRTNGLARWNGTWHVDSSLASLAPHVLCTLANGDLAIGGFNGYVARYDGSVLQPSGTGLPGTFPGLNTVRALVELPNGDLVAGGTFPSVGGQPFGGLARWDGLSWQPIGVGVAGSLPTSFASVAAVAFVDSSPQLWVGGSFALADGQTSHALAANTAMCPALAASTGAGCAGTLQASAPWIGGEVRAAGSGLPNSAAVISVQGMATVTLPLASLFATALPGCVLTVRPDHLALVFSTNGTVEQHYTIPFDPALVGVVFHQQLLPFEMGAPFAVTATNAVSMTVGAY
jgi:hypothetical protein